MNWLSDFTLETAHIKQVSKYVPESFSHSHGQYFAPDLPLLQHQRIVYTVKPSHTWS